MYNNTNWLDRVVDVETQEVLQEGTNQSAANFNNMEAGITDAQLAASLILLSAAHTADQVATEEQTITLTNSEAYPFNNSKTTVSLKQARNFATYTVDTEILSHNGTVGDIQITERLLNGFKVAYTGSATAVTLKLRINGGM